MIFLCKYKKYLYRYINQKVIKVKIDKEFIKDADLRGIFLNSGGIGLNTLSIRESTEIQRFGNIGYSYKYDKETNEITAIQLTMLSKDRINIQVIEHDVNNNSSRMRIIKYYNKYSPEYKKYGDSHIHYIRNRICLCSRHDDVKYKVKRDKLLRCLIL